MRSCIAKSYRVLSLYVEIGGLNLHDNEPPRGSVILVCPRRELSCDVLVYMFLTWANGKGQHTDQDARNKEAHLLR
jgi:hypothetical protein